MDNAARLGGSPRHVSLVGHSAGAHLCTMTLLHRALAASKAEGEPLQPGPQPAGPDSLQPQPPPLGAANAAASAGQPATIMAAPPPAAAAAAAAGGGDGYGDHRMPLQLVAMAGVYDISKHYLYEEGELKGEEWPVRWGKGRAHSAAGLVAEGLVVCVVTMQPLVLSPQHCDVPDPAAVQLLFSCCELCQLEACSFDAPFNLIRAAGRQVHKLSTMERACGGSHLFPQNSPAVILGNALRCGGVVCGCSGGCGCGCGSRCGCSCSAARVIYCCCGPSSSSSGMPSMVHLQTAAPAATTAQQLAGAEGQLGASWRGSSCACCQDSRILFCCCCGERRAAAKPRCG
jgi:hypothetical protein